MKNQRFRFRAAALLLAGLILLAGFSGLRQLPRNGSSASLRDAIRRLTGQPVSPSPEPSAPPSPAPGQSLWGAPLPAESGSASGQSLWGTPLPAETAPASGQNLWGTPFPETSPAPGQSLWGTPLPAQAVSPQPSAFPDPAPAAAETGAAVPGLPYLTPDVSNTPPVTAPAPLSEALSYYFGSQGQEAENPAAVPGEIP